jgi:hypothetical protein
MVLMKVHAVSAAAMDIDEYKMSNSGRDVSHIEKNGVTTVTHNEAPRARGGTEAVDPEQSAGLRKMEAITMVWTKKWLIAAYALYVFHSAAIPREKLARPATETNAD